MGVGFQFRILQRQSFGPGTGSHTRHSGHESCFEPSKDGINAKNSIAMASSCYGVAIFISESGGDGFSLLPVARADAKASPEKRSLRGFHFP
jgi:hypothetical protein